MATARYAAVDSAALHVPPGEIKHVLHWYKKSQIDYSERFIWLYVAYSSWYQRAIGTNNDRQALNELKKRFVIWDDYLNGRTLTALRPYMERLAEFTQREPFPATHMYWSGSLNDATDWRSLIEFWYQVRCLIVHGTQVRARYVWYAYETLDAFMGELIERMEQCFTASDLQRLKDVTALSQGASAGNAQFRVLQSKLQQKYISSPDIWQVDMQRVRAVN